MKNELRMSIVHFDYHPFALNNTQWQTSKYRGRFEKDETKSIVQGLNAN